MRKERVETEDTKKGTCYSNYGEDESQMAVRWSGEQLGQLTPYFLSFAHSWNMSARVDGSGSGQNINRESADGEESENGFEVHDDRKCRKGEQMTTAPGLKLERLEKGTGRSCTAAEETRERTSNLLCIHRNR